MKGPGVSRLLIKRITWSDWEACLRPGPLARTQLKPTSLLFTYWRGVRGPKLMGDWFCSVQRSRAGKYSPVAPRNSLCEEHFPARDLVACLSLPISERQQERLCGPPIHFCCLGESRLKGPGVSRLLIKRITWSDWEACLRPGPLARTQLKPTSLLFTYWRGVRGPKLMGDWFCSVQRSRAGKCFPVAPRDSLYEKHFPARDLVASPSCPCSQIDKELRCAHPRYRLGAARCKGPGASRLLIKRITWSDWEACLRPDPLARTQPKPTSYCSSHIGVAFGVPS